MCSSDLQALRAGEFDVLVGINLLREGLDLPEVSLVAILDADKEGFLRSAQSLIQTFGRAARNVAGRVLLYADAVTPSMRTAMDETSRRRARQEEYNREHGITPETIRKKWDNVLQASAREGRPEGLAEAAEDAARYAGNPRALAAEIKRMEREMRALAKDLEFEKAAALRDRISALREALRAAEAE